MEVYRIAKSLEFIKDITGRGAFLHGGRWNNKGTWMIYTSMNSSLAYLESLVHFDIMDIPPKLYFATLMFDLEDTLIYTPKDETYPKDWLSYENTENKALGDKWMKEGKFMAIRVRSAVNPIEYNYLLNPVFPGFESKVDISEIREIAIDNRLSR